MFIKIGFHNVEADFVLFKFFFEFHLTHIFFFIVL